MVAGSQPVDQPAGTGWHEGGPALARQGWRTYVRLPMERRYELESLRRSLAMLRPGAPALDREAAMRLVRELQDLERQLRTLREGLQQLLADE